MTDRKPLTSEEISAIVDGFEPIDRVQMELLAKMLYSLSACEDRAATKSI